MNFSGFENGLWDQGVVFGDKEEVEEGGKGGGEDMEMHKTRDRQTNEKELKKQKGRKNEGAQTKSQ